MNCPPKVIVLTGASGGLGQALASELAAPGRVLLLAGRNPERLAQVQALAEAKGAKVELLTCPLENHAAFAAALKDFDARHEIDLLVVNAGVKTGNLAGSEPMAETARVIDINLSAAISCVQAVLPGMIARGRGQIALLSSLAALSPHADLLSYTASKAGLRGYGAALRRSLRGSGVSVSLITPGFIDTPMTTRHLGPAPLLMSPANAARKIARGLAKHRAYITFPKALVLLVRLQNLLPVRLADWIDSFTRADIAPDEDERSRR